MSTQQGSMGNEKGKAKCWTPVPVVRQPTVRPQLWECPPAGWVKVNVDGSFIDQTGDAGVGVVIRDHKGEVLLTAWRVLFRCASANDAEGLACAEGLRLVFQWHPGPTILESDSARMVATLGDKSDDRSELRSTLLEAKEYLQLVPECNRVAHELAHLAKRNIHTVTWVRQAPACVIDLLNNDCNSLLG